MQKKVPHCGLAMVRQLIMDGNVRATGTATRNADLLGCDFDEMVTVVLALRPGDFYKSMTTYLDSTVWQDVYRPTTKFGRLYLKLTVVDDLLIVSFKEL